MNGTVIKYVLAHAAGFGSIAFAIGYAITGNWPAAGASILTAAAAFGLNVKPAQQ